MFPRSRTAALADLPRHLRRDRRPDPFRDGRALPRTSRRRSRGSTSSRTWTTRAASKLQQANALFADGPRHRARRSPGRSRAAGCVTTDHLDRGIVDNGYADDFPMALGQRRPRARPASSTTSICTPCHGLSGYGDGIVSKRADELAVIGTRATGCRRRRCTTSRPTTSVRSGTTTTRSPTGSATCRPTARMMTPEDRWAIVSYVKALQLSQRASADMVPAAERGQIARGN